MAVDPVELRRRMGSSLLERRERRSARSGVLSSGGFVIEGFADLEAKLAELPNNIARNATLRALRRAADIMAEEQRRLAPVGPTGNLRDSIRVSAKSRNLTGLAEYSAALQGGGSHRDASAALRSARRSGESAGTRIFLLIGSTAPHSHLVEFGTVERFHKSGKSTGTMPMQPFIRPAFDAKKGVVVAAIKRELTDEIARTSARLAKRAAREARS